ncbi:hypothetical protein Ahy_B09g095872 [Arachis hypogaea]|uniref:Uncharacterized protein n=1 Tax=Arachis hypogaea TaxID=3818 RepID=A0A444XH09_ARAHY|nr:hypothetical protein Ahy_B09g095872 [Arachis hypogaea]
MDKEVPVSQYSQCDVVTPPPSTKATLSSFPLPKIHYTSSSLCSSTSRRFRVRAYNNTSKFENFLNLKPAHQPKPLDFDLPWCHPFDRSRFDVIIIGSGPVGTRLAEQASLYGIKVCCVDPNPLSMWPNNYGVWVDEFESIDLEDCLEGVSPMGLNFTRESRPILSYMEVKKRMVARLRYLGVRVKKILDNEKQTCIHTITYAKKV